ncbi:DoxX protein [Halogranum amylolyticum]|uniref:DoxX protein n=1 Tax=Halogranum amylolyticum TaxID=660520 RepID=A0A1H8WN27_9EURY|nr:DoxX family membrane protein [Halogranum amylolyticum]SEP28488.1 DoxX protein [Halogranum amylolyticum]
MSETGIESVRSVRRSPPDWLLTGVRVVLVALVAKPAVSKFLTYGNSVAFFDAIGMPFPGLMVVIAGFIEVGAVVLLLVGVKVRLAALSLIPVMLVAMLHVGPDWKNLGVLFGAVLLTAFSPSLSSFWQSSG